MNKKGITLVELLAALALIAIIALIAVPILTGVIRDSQKDSNKINEESIKAVAEIYVTDNIGTNIDFDETPTITITLKQLIDGGYIAGDFKDKVTGENFNLETSTIEVTKEDNSYNYVVDLK